MLKNLDSKLSHLEESQCQDLQELLEKYRDLFPDAPSKKNQIFHDVNVGDAAPVKQHSYRLNPRKQQYLKEEIKYLSSNQVAVVGVLHVYLFQNQMEATRCVPITGKLIV